MSAPEGSTHFKITSAGATVDFENEKFEVDTHESDPIVIEFFQNINGVRYSLEDGSFCALKLVKVNGAYGMKMILGYWDIEILGYGDY